VSGVRNVGGTAGALVVALTLLPALPAGAAPLDTLLTALPEHIAPTGYMELAVDKLNGKLDFLNVRNSDPTTAGTTSGDYHGAHVTGDLRVAEGLWLSGSLWQRNVEDAADRYRYNSWQVAGQYRFNAAAGAMPALALRLSAWGNEASETHTTTPVHVPGVVLDTVTVSRPSDRQLQADLLGTWELSPALDITGVVSAGRTQLSYSGLAATTTLNGCPYQLAFNGNDIFGQLAGPCPSSGAVIKQFYDRSGDYGVDVAREIAWHGNFAQVGVNAAWRDGPWLLRGGYLFHAVQRDSVDAILATRGDPVHRRNHIVALEAGYGFNPNLGVFLRSQFSSNLFFNDIPVTYNSSTSGHFGSRYSLFSLGLRAGF